MIRILFIIALVSASSLMMYLTHQHLREELISQQNPIAAVPLDAALIIESNKLKKTWVSLSETNMIWSEMLEDQHFKSFDKALKQVDSLLIKDKLISEILHNNKVIISLHPGKNSLETFAVTNTKLRVFNSLIELMNSEGYKYIHKGQKKGSVNEFSKKNGEKFFLAYYEPFLMYSTSEILIGQSFLQLKKGSGFLKDKDFLKLSSTISSSSNLHVYVQINQFIKMAANYFDKAFIQSWQSGDFFNGWLELDLMLKPNSILLSGLSLFTENGLMDQSIKRQQPNSNKEFMMIPYDVKFIKRQSISNITDFIKDHSIVDKSIMDKACKCNSESLIDELMGGEMIYNIFGRNENEHHALFLEKSGYEKSRQILSQLGLGDSLVSKNGDQEFYKLNSNLFTKLLGVKLNNEAVFYIEKGDYIVLSSMKGLESLKSGWKKAERKSTFTNYSYYSLNYLANFSSVDYYWSNNGVFKEIRKQLKKEYKSTFDHFSATLDDIDGTSFQASSTSSNFNYHSYAVSTGNSTVEESNQLWVVEIDSISRVPEYMKNHRTKTLEVLVQDDNHVLYLISATGKIKWSRSVEGPIIGKVKQIDVLSNGKWQMLFNTASKIHLLDINGDEVTGYPILLNSAATNSVAVLDYENNENYRYLISCQDQKIYNFNKKGKSLPDWKYPELKSIVSSEIEHFVVQNKDYLFVYDDKGNIYLFDRRGNVRHETDALCKPDKTQNFRLKKGYNIDDTKVVYVDSINQFIAAEFNGQIDTMQLDFSCLTKQCNLKLIELGNDNLIGYFLSSGHKISIYGPDKKLLFFDDLGFYVGHNFAIAGNNRKYIVVNNEATQEIYLYDNDFNAISIFPAPGSSKTIIGDMNFDGLDDVVTITIDGRIIAYSINKPFN